MEPARDIDNSFYESYGDRWYTAYDDPVAILRAETKVKIPWILERLRAAHGSLDLSLLDVGCGGGLVSNELSKHGVSKVTGLDLSSGCLSVARRWDSTKKVRYLQGDATHLPLPCASFDCVVALDLLEHVENPEAVISECARVLKPGGLFIFQTINRSWVSGLIGIKFVEWFVRNTPPRMHLLRMFIKPEELRGYCQMHGLEVKEITGVRPRISSIPLSAYLKRTVPESLAFQLTDSTLLSYLGCAKKSLPH